MQSPLNVARIKRVLRFLACIIHDLAFCSAAEWQERSRLFAILHRLATALGSGNHEDFSFDSLHASLSRALPFTDLSWLSASELKSGDFLLLSDLFCFHLQALYSGTQSSQSDVIFGTSTIGHRSSSLFFFVCGRLVLHPFMSMHWFPKTKVAFARKLGRQGLALCNRLWALDFKKKKTFDEPKTYYLLVWEKPLFEGENTKQCSLNRW